jgi:hypothetical protein
MILTSIVVAMLAQAAPAARAIESWRVIVAREILAEDDEEGY